MEVSAIILLDDVSKLKIKTNVSILGPKGFKFIDSLDEINDDLVEATTNVIILEGFTQRPGCVSDLVLYKELFGLNYFYLGADESWMRILKEFAHCFKCDISLLSYELIHGALYNDKVFEDPEAESKVKPLDLALSISKNRNDFDTNTVTMADVALSWYDKAKYLEQKISVLNKRNSSLETMNEKIRADRELLLKGYNQILDEAAREQSMLKQYEAVFTSDVYNKIRLHDYTSRPLVLYFKEYEDFLYLDSMIETLYSVFRLQERKSVKVLRLFDSRTSRKMLTVPSYYKRIYNDYSIADVTTNDYVCKSGDYQRIMDKLLLNELGLDVLIIIDSKDYNDTVLSGMPLQMNLCREYGHLEAFGLNEVNTIINYGKNDDKITWMDYDVTDMEDDDKFLFLSSRPVIRNVLDLCHLFEDSV